MKKQALFDWAIEAGLIAALVLMLVMFVPR